MVQQHLEDYQAAGVDQSAIGREDIVDHSNLVEFYILLGVLLDVEWQVGCVRHDGQHLEVLRGECGVSHDRTMERDVAGVRSWFKTRLNQKRNVWLRTNKYIENSRPRCKLRG